MCKQAAVRFRGRIIETERVQVAGKGGGDRAVVLDAAGNVYLRTGTYWGAGSGRRAIEAAKRLYEISPDGRAA